MTFILPINIRNRTLFFARIWIRVNLWLFQDPQVTSSHHCFLCYMNFPCNRLCEVLFGVNNWPSKPEVYKSSPLTAWFCKQSFNSAQPCLLVIYCLWLLSKWQSWVFVTTMESAAAPKVFILQYLTEKNLTFDLNG